MAGRVTPVFGNRAKRRVSLASVALALGCGGQSLSRDTNDGESNGGSSPGGTAGAPRGGNAGTAGGVSSGGTQITGIPNGGVSSGGAPTGGATSGGTSGCDGEDLPVSCVCATMTATILVPNFFVALDRSEAMAGERWNRALETLMVFFSDPDLHMVGMTLGTFPDTFVPPACDDITCSPAACNNSLVGLARLTSDGPPQDMQETALLEVLRGLTPDGPAAPLPPALEGALEWAEDHVSRYPDELANVILVSSGELDACPATSVESAARAYDERSIRTHVLGFEDGNRRLLDDIALAGGTDQALMLGNDVEANAADLKNLARLNPGDIGCDFPLPSGDNLDFTNVSVILSTVTGASLHLVQVPAAGACSDRTPTMPPRDFYFDDPANPTTLVLCPGSCNALSSRAYDMLEVSIACAQ